MSGTSTSGADSKDDSRRWAALDSQNERLADASELLLLKLNRDRADAERPLKAAS
jgi:hypothetical protein